MSANIRGAAPETCFNRAAAPSALRTGVAR